MQVNCIMLNELPCIQLAEKLMDELKVICRMEEC